MMRKQVSRTETWRNDKTGKSVSFKVYTDESVKAGPQDIPYPVVTQQLEAEGFDCKERDLHIKSAGIDTALTSGTEDYIET